MARERQTGRSGGRSRRDDDGPTERFSKDYVPKKRSSSSRFSRDSGSRGGSRGGFSRDSGSRGGRDRRDRPEMHEVTCDQCNKQCKVPFLPSSDKPVYCSECFEEKGNSRSSGSRSGGSSSELKVINEKLDKIMRALKI